MINGDNIDFLGINYKEKVIDLESLSQFSKYKDYSQNTTEKTLELNNSLLSSPKYYNLSTITDSGILKSDFDTGVVLSTTNIITFDLMSIKAINQSILYFSSTDSNLFSMNVSTSGQLVLKYGTSSTSSSTSLKCINSSNWVNYRIEEKDKVIKIYENDTLILTKSLTGLLPTGELLVGGTTSVSTTLVDPYIQYSIIVDADTNNNVNVYGKASVSSIDKKYGLNSYSLGSNNTGGDHLRISNSSSHGDFANSDFTIECYIKPTILPTGSGKLSIISKGSSNSIAWYLSCNNTGIQFNWTYDSISLQSVQCNYTLTTDWTHIAVSREGNNIYITIDGILKVTGNITSSIFHNASYGILIGGIESNNTSVNNFFGFIDSVRITKGVCRYSSNFTPDENTTCSFISNIVRLQGSIKNLKVFDSSNFNYLLTPSFNKKLVKYSVRVIDASTDFSLSPIQLTNNEFNSEELISIDSLKLECIGSYSTIIINYKEGTIKDRLLFNDKVIDILDYPTELIYTTNSSSVNLNSVVKEFEITFTSEVDIDHIYVNLDSYKVKLIVTRVGYSNIFSTSIVELDTLVNNLTINTTLSNTKIDLYGIEKDRFNFSTVKDFYSKDKNTDNIHFIQFNDGSFITQSLLSELLYYSKLPSNKKLVTLNKNYFGDYSDIYYNGYNVLVNTYRKVSNNSIRTSLSTTSLVFNVDMSTLDDKKNFTVGSKYRVMSNVSGPGTYRQILNIKYEFTLTDGSVNLFDYKNLYYTTNPNSGYDLFHSSFNKFKYNITLPMDAVSCNIVIYITGVGYGNPYGNVSNDGIFEVLYMYLSNTDVDTIKKFESNTTSISKIKELVTIGGN